MHNVYVYLYILVGMCVLIDVPEYTGSLCSLKCVKICVCDGFYEGMMVDGERNCLVLVQKVLYSCRFTTMVKKAAQASFPILATSPKCVSVMTMIYYQLPSCVCIFLLLDLRLVPFF